MTDPDQPLSAPLPAGLVPDAGRGRLSAGEARERRAAHQLRADALTAGYRERKQAGLKHPVEDFLFTYYPFSPARLRRWHPGWRTSYDPAADLTEGTSTPADGDIQEDGSRTRYRDATDPAATGPARSADVPGFLNDRGDAVRFIGSLLRSSSMVSRTANFSCFGLHEWAMVYRLAPGQQRHEDLPLRLSQEETDAVVAREKIVCSHIDAFRFFTPEAKPLNSMAPSRETQVLRDNPACLHVGMDLYKWAMKLTPLLPSALVLNAFEHARDTRVLDMEASPYDVRPLGYGAVRIETAAGKEEYERRQRQLAARAETIRQEILQEIDPLLAPA